MLTLDLEEIMISVLVAVLGVSGYIFIDLMQLDFKHLDETKIVLGVAVLISFLKLFKDVVMLKVKVLKQHTLLKKAETALNSQTYVIEKQHKCIKEYTDREIKY